MKPDDILLVIILSVVFVMMVFLYLTGLFPIHIPMHPVCPIRPILL